MISSRRRIFLISALTPVLGAIIYFLTYTSIDPHWGGGFWEQWLAARLQLSAATAHAVIFWLRKSLHLLGYGGLGLLFWYYFYLWRLRRPLVVGLLATLAVAVFDEYQQYHTSFRSGRGSDVLLDLVGAIVATGLVRWFKFSRRSGNKGDLKEK